VTAITITVRYDTADAEARLQQQKKQQQQGQIYTEHLKHVAYSKMQQICFQ